MVPRGIREFTHEKLVSPMSVNPNVATGSISPVAGNPVRVLVWRIRVRSRNPDIRMPVPAVISGLPNPARMFMGWWWNNLVVRRRGPDTNVNLRPRSRGDSEKRRKGGSKQLLSHEVTPSMGRLPRAT